MAIEDAYQLSKDLNKAVTKFDEPWFNIEKMLRVRLGQANARIGHSLGVTVPMARASSDCLMLQTQWLLLPNRGRH